MTRLLVSVRDAVEASTAAAAGADLIDLKEPTAGALGAVATGDWPALRAAVPAAIPMSVALGELNDVGLTARLAQTGLFQFAKIGLAGWRRRADWRDHLAAAWRRLPPSVIRVAVAYADEHQADAPPPEAILDAAESLAAESAIVDSLAVDSLSAGALLIDTFDKQAGSLFELLDATRLHALCQRARRLGMLVVLAGSLRRERLADALAFAPDYIAVRGAVCHPDRAGRLVAARVREWATALANHNECRQAIDGARGLGETGLGETGPGETGPGETGPGETGLGETEIPSALSELKIGKTLGGTKTQILRFASAATD